MHKWFSVKGIVISCITFAGILSNVQAQSENQCRDIFNQMFNAINNVRTLRYNLYAVERIDNTFACAHSSVKLNISPFKAYYKNLDKGIEVLWVDGKEDGDAIVNPNGFPFVNLHLNPSGELMRKGQHQTILRLGYTYLGDMLSHSLAKFPDAFKNYVHCLKDTIWDNNPCYKVEVNFTQYATTPYIVTQKGETVSKIATQYSLCEYEVLTTNNISWYEDELKVGQTLQLPAAYAKHLVLLISKKNNLPLVIRVYDDKGLFEMYSFSDLQVNPTIPDPEFMENYSGYHF